MFETCRENIVQENQKKEINDIHDYVKLFKFLNGKRAQK